MAPIRPLAWEPPYAAGVAQEMAKRQKKKNPSVAMSCGVSSNCSSNQPLFWELRKAASTAIKRKKKKIEELGEKLRRSPEKKKRKEKAQRDGK